MAGYMTKLQGYVYEGELINQANAPVANGQVMILNRDSDGVLGLAFGAADSTTTFEVKEITTIFGETRRAARCIITKLDKPYYFVENGYEVREDVYDTRDYVTAAGKRLRAHPMMEGEEFIVSIPDTVQDNATQLHVLADGVIG